VVTPTVTVAPWPVHGAESGTELVLKIVVRR
jgi:hypothetical protein